MKTTTTSPLGICQEFEIPRYGRDCRGLFFINHDVTNLNHGSFGAIPEAVQGACEALTRECEGNPDAFIRGQLFGRFKGVREVLSQLIGANSDECVFVNNVATAMNTVLRNINMTSKDFIICTDAVFESVTLAINNTAGGPRTSVFTLGDTLSHHTIIKQFRDHIQMVKEKICVQSNTAEATHPNDSPKMVAIIESITATPGLLLPWKEMVRICREENIWSVVDAAHSLGQEIDINLEKVGPDFWMTNCGKWYYAQRGCAVLYVPFRNQHMIKTQLVPGVLYPVRGHSPTSFIHKFYWSGLIDPVPAMSIKFSKAFRDRLGGERKINDYCHTLAIAGGLLVAKMLGTTVMDQTERGELTANMTNIELPLQSSIPPSKDVFFIFQDQMIDVHKVFAPAFYYSGRWWARASAQIYNDLSDFERLGHALSQTCQKIKEHMTRKESCTYRVSGKL